MSLAPDDAAAAGGRSIDLLDSLGGEWLKLPFAVMRDRGPAVQTLGGLLRVTKRETFCEVAKIAEKARLPTRTAREHLRALAAGGWIENRGRERTRRGVLRRTATLKITRKTDDALDRREDDDLVYGFLPWWGCCHILPIGVLPWSSKAILSVVMSRLLALKAAIDRHDGQRLERGDAWYAIEHLGGGERFRFSMRRLHALTGLSFESVLNAKRHLARCGAVDWSGGETADGSPYADALTPKRTFRVIVTPAGNGRCVLQLGGRFDSCQ